MTNTTKTKYPVSAVIFLITAAVLFFGFVPVCHAGYDDSDEHEVLLFADFESASHAAGWEPFGDTVTLKNDSSKSHSGNYSLRASDRSQKYDGPSVNLTQFCKPGQTYCETLWVSCDTYDSLQKVDNHEKTTITVSLKTTYTGADDQYDNLEVIYNAGGNQWTKSECIFTIPSDADTAYLYVECMNPNCDLWIDDVLITTASETEKSESIPRLNPSGTTVFDFEIHNYQEITKTRNAICTYSDAVSISGQKSLHVSNRTDSRDGMALSVDAVSRDVAYRAAASVTFTDKNLDEEFFSMFLEYKINNVLYNIPVKQNQAVERGSWSTITGLFTVPEEAADPRLTITSVRPDDEYNYTHVSFYVDNFTVSDDTMTLKEKFEHNRKFRTAVIISAVSVIAIAAAAVVLVRSSVSKKKILNPFRDEMTGAYSRNAYEELVKRLEKKPDRCKALHFAVCDVNNLKDINDIYGHKAGDESIVRCAAVLLEAASRTGGKVYRTGGDEFVVVSGKKFSDVLNEAVADAEHTDSRYPFEIAVGYAEYNPYEDGAKPDIKSIIARCDKEMYINKNIKKSGKKFMNS